LDEMLSKPPPIPFQSVGIERIGRTRQVGVEKAQQAGICILIATVGRGGQQEHVASVILDEALHQGKALLCALLAATDAATTPHGLARRLYYQLDQGRLHARGKEFSKSNPTSPTRDACRYETIAPAQCASTC